MSHAIFVRPDLNSSCRLDELGLQVVGQRLECEPVAESFPSVIIRYVPKYYDELDTVLRALADPTRRAVVERLAKSPAVVSELAAPFSMALPSLMQHLSVLENAGVVTSEKHGRVRTVSLRPGALDVLHLWLGEQRTPAEHQADRLGIHLTLTTPKEI
jgi:DNA-binding transcriptional ArsR family regulator